MSRLKLKKCMVRSLKPISIGQPELLRMKNILITGRPRAGKTTLIKRVLEGLDAEAGGFYTQELTQHGRRIGFELVTLAGRRGIMAHVDIEGGPRVGKYGVDLKVVNDLGVREVERSIADCELVAIDEIGKMELYSARFRDAVLAALNSPKILLATIGVGGSQFTNRVRRRADVELHEVDAGNRDILPGEILGRLTERLNRRR